ncbi:MAG: hypothetical protein J0647_04455 [Campylobacteraceae bacterium]|nr:hypothetical protein [Campylobacteraceae bacterium]
MYFYKIYHANLAFSAIEESEIPTVIDKCYFPLLDLVEALHVKIGLELSGFTLEKIQRYRPQWIARFKQLCKNHEMELIGSGYMQLIGPLVPYEVNIKNQQIGLETYQNILGITPKIAYINEQTFSKSMVDIYHEAGYEAIAMEWNNAFSIHPKWKKSYAYTPAIAEGVAQKIPILWTDSILFQQFQRTIHSEQSFDDYFNFFTNYVAAKHKCIPIYSSDLEIFNYRPGRFETEANLNTNEWDRTKEMLILLQQKGIFELPSTILHTHVSHKNVLSLTNSANPIIVKKQDKYALGRWSACGHDTNYINTLCYNYFEMLNEESTLHEWKELLRCWGSDYRTHTTVKKWQEVIETLESKLNAFPTKKLPQLENDVELTHAEHKILFEKDGLKISFWGNKGLALDEMFIHGIKQPFGTIKHGELSHIGYVADFFTGSSVIESSQTKKVSDLVPVSHCQFNKIAKNTYTLSTTINMRDIATEYKCWTIDTLNHTLMLSIDLKLHTFIAGSIRLGTFTLLPQKTSSDLYYLCHNGGRNAEKHSLVNTEIKHHLSKSLLQSSSSGIGATDGKIIFANSSHNFVTLTINQQKSSPLVMLQNTINFNKYLTRVFFSVQELDDTLKRNEKKLERVLSLQYTILPSNRN